MNTFSNECEEEESEEDDEEDEDELSLFICFLLSTKNFALSFSLFLKNILKLIIFLEFKKQIKIIPIHF